MTRGDLTPGLQDQLKKTNYEGAPIVMVTDHIILRQFVAHNYLVNVSAYKVHWAWGSSWRTVMAHLQAGNLRMSPCNVMAQHGLGAAIHLRMEASSSAPPWV